VRFWVSVVIGGLALLLASSASAHTPDVLAEYGAATVDGVISPGEYEHSCIGPTGLAAGGTLYQLTVCEKNDEQNDYWAVQITDLTNDTGQLSDSPLIWFDNDHSGSVTMSGPGCTYGQPDEDRIGWDGDTFVDDFYCRAPEGFTGGLDFKDPLDGAGAHKFTPGQGSVFEFSHPLDSGDVDDYSLALHDTVGWCLTYDDQSNHPPNNPGFAFGELQYPPGCFVDFTSSTRGLVRGDSTLLGDVYKRNAMDEVLDKIRDKLKHLVATCKHCPPDPTKKLLDRVNEAIKALLKQQQAKTLKALTGFIKLTHDFIDAGELPAAKAKKFLKQARPLRSLVKNSKSSTAVPTSTIAGGLHTHQFRVSPNGVG